MPSSQKKKKAREKADWGLRKQTLAMPATILLIQLKAIKSTLIGLKKKQKPNRDKEHLDPEKTHTNRTDNFHLFPSQLLVVLRGRNMDSGICQVLWHGTVEAMPGRISHLQHKGVMQKAGISRIQAHR